MTSELSNDSSTPFWNLKLLREPRLNFLADRFWRLTKRFALAAALLFIGFTGYHDFPSYPYLNIYEKVWESWTTGEPLQVGSQVAQSLAFAPIFGVSGLAVALTWRRSYWRTASRLDEESQGWLRFVSGSWRIFDKTYALFLTLRDGGADYVRTWLESMNRRDLHLIASVLTSVLALVLVVTVCTGTGGGQLFAETAGLLLALVVFFRSRGD
jgi:hypothetical protein